MADVLYVLSGGFPIRMILHTDVIFHLHNLGSTVEVLSTVGADAELERITRQKGVPLHVSSIQQSRLLREYLPTRRYLFDDISSNPALLARHLRDVDSIDEARAPWFASLRAKFRGFLFLYNRAIARRLESHSLLGWVEAHALRSKSASELLSRLKPRLVVCTYPVDPSEIQVLAAARNLGIPSAVHQLSWDNITTKGSFPVVPDYFLSWGPMMTEEILETYSLPRDRLFEVGVPHLECHHTLAKPELSAQSLVEMGLDPQVPFVLFGMSSPVFSPEEISIVERLAREISADRFGCRINLVIRPHPQNVSGYMADPSWLPRLKRVASPRVGVLWPKLNPSSIQWSLSQSDLAMLVSMVRACTLNINSGSTFALDGLAHGKPVILTLFDGDRQYPWHRSACRIADYTHIRKLTRAAGIPVARSYASLMDQMAKVLGNIRPPDPSLSALRHFCHNANLGAAGNVAKALKEILRREGGSKEPCP